MTFRGIINQNKPVLVDFFAEWYNPYKMISFILVDEKNGVGENTHIIKIDVDKKTQVAIEYQLHGLPTIGLFKNGKLHWRQTGVVAANELENLINTNR
jgi:thioredoxin 1